MTNWPSFTASNGSWAATFDSYNQYKEEAFYWIEPLLGAGFMIAFDTHYLRLDWTDAEEVKQVRQQVSYWADKGETNTEYRGRYS
jgi:hypothetical protein